MANTQLVRTYDGLPVTDPVHERTAMWTSNQAAQQHMQDSSSRYRALLRRHTRAMIWIVLSFLGLSLLVTALMPPRYSAKTLIEILAVNQDFMNNKDVDPNVSSSTMDTYLDTQTRLLTSSSVMDRVLSSLLANEKQYEAAPTSSVAKVERSLGLQPAPRVGLEADIRYCLAHLKIKAQGQSSLLAITVSGPTAQLAADTANAVANQHIAELQEARWAMANQTTDFLTTQLNSLRTKLKQSEDDLQAYARRTGLLFPGGAGGESVGSEKLREVQSDLEKAESDRADKQAQMEMIDSSTPDSLPKILDDGNVREAKSRLADLQRQLADLSSLYTPNHYKVKQVESQIAAVEDQLKQDKTVILTRLRTEYRGAVRKEALQRQEYDQQLALVTDQSSKEVGYNLLKREVDANRDLYQSMLQKIKEASVVAALRASNIRVVDRAKPATSPDEPNPVLNMGFGLLAGCMAAILFVLVKERSDRSIRIVGQTTKALQLPELAIVPSASKDIRTQIVSASRNAGKRFGLQRAFFRSAQSALPDLSRELVTNWRTTGSVVAESFRSAVASIIVWGRDATRNHKILLITSAHCGAGKTTSVLNLGLGLVESGRKVLLIDGDLRLPRLGELFGLESATGLTDILAEALHPTVASELIVETGLQGLHLLPAGSRYMNVTELLHSDDLPALLDHLRAQYDFILIDTPPAIPLTDARLMAHHADGVVMVVRAGSTTIEQTLAVQQQFLQDGGLLLGTILNQWDARSEDPAYMNSYMKYAAFNASRGRTKVRLNVKKSAAGNGN